MGGPLLTNATYTLVFSPSAAPLFPSVQDHVYWFSPGETYLSDHLTIGGTPQNITYYYQNYFSTWSDFMTLKNGSWTMTTGPFAPTADATTHYTYTSTVIGTNTGTNTLAFSLDLNRLNHGNSLSTVYFTVLVTDGSGTLVDALDTQASFRDIVGESKSDTDAVDNSIAAGLDIRQWSVVVQ
jgi:hypothetical protein